MLAAGARRAVGVGAHVRLVDVDLDRVVDHRIDPDAGERGVPARVAVEGRDAHQPVHARLGLQPAIGVRALDLQRRRLDARLLAGVVFEDLDLVAVLLRPARVHAHEHLGPVLALGAAGAGMDLEIGVVAVGLAGEHRLDLAALGLGLRARGAPPRPRRRPTRSSSASASSISSIWSASSRSIRSTASIWSASCWRSRIIFCARSGEFQRSGSSAAAFSSARRALARSQSKMPPQQADAPA